jgi:hypothetical protein
MNNSFSVTNVRPFRITPDEEPEPEPHTFNTVDSDGEFDDDAESRHRSAAPSRGSIRDGAASALSNCTSLGGGHALESPVAYALGTPTTIPLHPPSPAPAMPTHFGGQAPIVAQRLRTQPLPPAPSAHDVAPRYSGPRPLVAAQVNSNGVTVGGRMCIPQSITEDE